MTTCLVHFLESYPESCPRIILSHVLKRPFVFIELASRDDLVQLLSNPASSFCVRQCHQNDLVHKMCNVLKVFDTSLFFVFFQKQLHTRIIPRIIPDTYPESYLNLASPAKQGYICVDSKQARANHTETYLESYPLMQHALLTPEF